jgi:hypothetical protein
VAIPGEPPLVAIIDESTAREYWPTRDPLGRRVRFKRGPTTPWTTIAGIVKDIKSDGLDIDDVPHVYVSTYQDSQQAAKRGVADVSALGPTRTTDSA